VAEATRGIAGATAAVLLAALLVAACGDDGKPRLVVSAASSLRDALTSCSAGFPDAKVRLQFAGSDELAAQIRRGVRPDVFAAANTKLPDELNADGLLNEPVVFATNELVLAVPDDARRVDSLDDLQKPGTKLAIGSQSVPVGSYTRDVLSRLPGGERSQILKNVRSEEPDAKGVVGKLTQGAVDAGFVYASDVSATKGKLRAVDLPGRLKPTVEYGAGAVRGADQPKAAQNYVNGLAAGVCADALRESGFGPTREAASVAAK
jgi:molybdate transport system substrate-binding protein